MYWRCFSSVMRRCNLRSTKSKGKSAQFSFERYVMTRPVPSLPWRTWCRLPPELRQSFANNASKCWLKVSCGVSPSAEFMTNHSLSSLEPLGTESARDVESAPISLTASLMAAMVDISEGGRELTPLKEYELAASG